MRVGLITYALDRPVTGITRYTLELARALSSLRDQLELVLLVAGSSGPLEKTGLRSVSLPGCRLLPGLMTLGNGFILQRARQIGLDLVHDPTGVTPFLFGAGGARMVVTVHDVIAWTCQGVSSRLGTVIYRYWLPNLLGKRAKAIVTASSQSRHDILKYLRVSSDCLRIIPYGIGQCFEPLPAQVASRHLEQRFGVSGSYILYVGALTQRKNIQGALEAFSLVVRRNPSLRFIIAGPPSWKQSPVQSTSERLGIADKILLTGPVGDADLVALYNGADLLVFPSLYEGFGLPPLESMACGTPVVCSNAASLPEVVGDAAITVDPHDTEALAEAIKRVLSDPELAQEMREKGLGRAKQFTWEDTARKTLAVYRQVCGLSHS